MSEYNPEFPNSENTNPVTAVLQGAASLLVQGATKAVGLETDTEKLVAEQPQYDVQIGLDTVARGFQQEDAELVAFGQQFLDKAREATFGE